MNVSSKKIILLLFIIVLTLTSCADGNHDSTLATDNTSDAENNAVAETTDKLEVPELGEIEDDTLPSVRVTQGVIIPDYPIDHVLSLDSTIQKKNAILYVRIRSYLGEYQSIQSAFLAEVLNVIKGENVPDVIVVYQIGNTLAQIPDLPTFVSGNELILFGGMTDQLEYEIAFSLDFKAILDVVSFKDNLYLVSRDEEWGKCVSQRIKKQEDMELISNLKAKIIEEDSIWADSSWQKDGRSYEYVFNYDDLVSYIQKESKK